MSQAVLGLDVGTTVVKAVLFDLRGAELCAAGRAIPLQTPVPGWAELDPERIWDAVLAVLSTVTAKAPLRHEITAIGLAAQGGTLIPASADGTPVHPAITWMDRRSEAIVHHWHVAGTAATIRRISGWAPAPGLPIASLAWLRQVRPELFAVADHFLSVNDFLLRRLVGRFFTDPSMAGEMLLADVAAGEWSEELCALAGIQTGQLSPIRPPGTVLGAITSEVSCLTGLPSNTPVVMGGQDHSCEAVALRLTSPGDALLACGTAWVINRVVTSPSTTTLPAAMNVNAHVLPLGAESGRHPPLCWIASQFLGAFGASLNWWLTNVPQAPTAARNPEMQFPLDASSRGAVSSDRYTALDGSLEPPAEDTAPNDSALATRAGCNGLLFLSAWGYVGLRLDHTPSDMGRAILEGAAYELRLALEAMARSGLGTDRLWLVGGAARGRLWPAILADVTGLTLELPRLSHGPARGAAILACLGTGQFEGLDAAWDRFRTDAHTVTPNAAQSAAYDRQFSAYRQAGDILAAHAAARS